jgi:ribose 5-phosphate isomerase B
MDMRIAIAADHNGVPLKVDLSAWLTAHGHEVDDRGTQGTETVDYPALCEAVSRQVVDGHADRGIVIGGTGSGEQIACNKIRGVRAGLCHNVLTAEIARAHNDTNVLVIGAKVVTAELAQDILSIWMATAFKGGPHQRRLDQIAALERGESLL